MTSEQRLILETAMKNREDSYQSISSRARFVSEQENGLSILGVRAQFHDDVFVTIRQLLGEK